MSALNCDQLKTITSGHTCHLANQKAQIRKTIRKRRKNLSYEQQTTFAKQIATHVLNLIDTVKQQTKQIEPIKVALFLSMDGEIDTTNTIQALWAQHCEVYLPRIHPFNPQQLIFLHYQPNTPLTKSSLGINEPQLNCQQLCPVNQLDIIFTPLVAFDTAGHRLGMGGGFYDRTLAPLYDNNASLDNQNYRSFTTKPRVIGLAHNCQQIEQVPIQSWDIPLAQIITPKGPILNHNQPT